MSFHRLQLLLLALFLTSCTLRPPYEAPKVAPATLHESDAAFFAAKPYDAKWWRQFDDPTLESLENAALLSNHDVRIAVARVQQARAAYNETSLDRFPKITATASLDRRESAIPGFVDEPLARSTYTAGFDAFWELDLFGRVRAQVRGANAAAQSVEASLDDVLVSVSAEVARNYFELRGLQQQLAVAERSLANQRETLRLTQLRRDAGVGEEQDVASAAARVAGTEASLSPLRASIAGRRYRIAVLAGVRPGELSIDLSPKPYATIAKELPLGDPSQLLRRRADIRAAERRLAAADATVDLATADLWPRISISGFLGLLAGRGNLFGTSDSRAWAVTPAISWSAFDLGSARARLRGAKAGESEALAAYEQTVLGALEETEDALVAYREQQQRLVKLNDQARESARAASIARARYREGVADFLTLLDAERTQLQAEDAVAQGESGVFTSVVAVYKALGGISE